MAVRQELPWWRMAALFCALIFLGQSVEAGNEAAEARMRKDVTFLASDECEGRGVTTKGINLAADYIANEFKKAGLKPAGVDGTYFQPFTMSGGSRLESPNTLVLRGPLGQEIELRQGVHFQVVGMSATGKVNAPVVFAGYGATSNGGSQSNLQAVDPARTFGGQSTKAAEKKKVSYDDFQGMDVAGKLVVILRRTPRAGNAKVPFDGPYMDYHAALNTKIGNAEAHNAAGILFVNDQGMAGADDRLMDFGYTAFESNSKLPAVHIRRSVANTMLQSSLGKTLTELEADIAHEFKPQSAALAGWTASLETNVRRVRTPVKNIIAMVEGSGPLAKEIVVLGAHYDHLGYGGFGSLARNLKGKAIHHGADDNGSGTTMIMELARRFAQKEHQGRRLVFMAFSGEESGLLGSAYYCRNPVFPLADTAVMVNMDMVGRLRPDKDTNKDKLIVYGTGSGTGFDKLIDSVNARYDFKLNKISSGMGPSDQQSFYVQKIPVFFFFTGDHSDYHRPSDTADKINIAGMGKVADMVEELVDNLRITLERPTYVKVASSQTPRMGGPRLGIQPTYGDDKDGVLLSGTSPDTPAAKAGLKEGDRIIEISGKPVKNLEAYMSIMAGHKMGDALSVVILRDGKKMDVRVKLE